MSILSQDLFDELIIIIIIIFAFYTQRSINSKKDKGIYCSILPTVKYETVDMT